MIISEPAFRRVPADMFAWTTSERADLNTAVMHLFGLANERLATALTFDEVLAGLPETGWRQRVTELELDERLAKLVEYGLLDRTQNHAAQYSSAEEYERRNLQYSLTRKGEAAYEGVLHALYLLSSTGALQTAVLDAIADRLDGLYVLLGDAGSDDRRIYTTLSELEGHLQALRTNTKQFNGQLARLLRDEGSDLTTFQEVKRSTVAYLEEFVTNLDQRKRTIAEAVARVEQRGVPLLHNRALAGAELPVLPDQPESTQRWLDQRAVRWKGLRDWFLPVDGSRPRAEQLRDIARHAIVSLLRALERLGEARRRRAGTAADFRTLARWFACCETTDDAHRLWVVAFGLWPSRHAHLCLDDPRPVPTVTRWWDAPTVAVSPLLRSHGRLEWGGRTARVRDVSAVRQRRRAAAQRERTQLQAAWSRLATPGTVRLSAFARLDFASFSSLLELLGRALGGRADAGGCRRAGTADGRLWIELTDPGDGRIAVVRTPLGRFSGPDYWVRIAPAYTEELLKPAGTERMGTGG